MTIREELFNDYMDMETAWKIGRWVIHMNGRHEHICNLAEELMLKIGGYMIPEGQGVDKVSILQYFSKVIFQNGDIDRALEITLP